MTKVVAIIKADVVFAVARDKNLSNNYKPLFGTT
jgi:hypothetical protein